MKIINTSKMKSFALSMVLFFALTLTTHATVGGPTYIGSFKYNHADESVYFMSISESGRGCPPILEKISLTSEAVSPVISCDQAEALIYNESRTQTDDSKLYEEINKVTANTKDLTPISLTKNNIEIDVVFVREEKIPEDDYVFRNHFIANVYQDGQKIDEFPITGCSKEQPFTFAGYAIPGFQQKIVILSSAKSDCMEGGYIGENLNIVDKLTHLDSTQVGTWKSELRPLVPDEGTLIVYEKDSTIADNVSNKTTATFSTQAIILSVFALLIGVCIGMVWKKS